ncbi:MAG: cell division protein ZapD [Gammaproteobacteria bacterium]|nr:cell division protein ZapD [Gammaproteobacteria bacterium]
MSESSESWIVYEQPLGERVRTMLRLEHLFSRISTMMPSHETWGSRIAVESLIDVLAVIGRTDIRKELVKELERHTATMEALQVNPNVDPRKLGQVLEELNTTLTELKGTDAGFGQELRNDELVNAVRQRSSMPAGTCDFDLPAYHYWLSQPPELRQQDLSYWNRSFDLLRRAVALCLHLVRSSGGASSEIATGGFFQRSLESATPCQMIRVRVPFELEAFPEISAGRHRFTVRFMCQQNTAERPLQTDFDVQFVLSCCFI